MFTIDKTIPVPTHHLAKYPFKTMEVGDSFFAEGKTPTILLSAAKHVRKNNGWKFASRKEGTGARIWRIA